MNKTFSPYRIATLVVFVCAALITILFLFHLKQPTVKTVLSADAGTVFPIGRSIRNFELVTAQQPFTQKELLGHWTLITFGFVHCSTVCPITLAMLDKTYQQLHADYPNLQVVFVSLDPERDLPNTVADYARSFNPAFIGVTGKVDVLRKLQSQLGIYAERDPAPNTNGHYQIQHTPSILLINPQGKWAGIFKYGMNPNQFAAAFKESVEALEG
ncbi:MAG TPA: SCO family protein [Gammaproteobacteria bacterium]|jgi:protein SCO1/2|nr:SCO family protein [Gammaproteobacteria bacterium]